MRANNLIVLKYLAVAATILLMGIFVTGCSDEAAPTADSSIENPTGVLSNSPVIHRVSVGGADICEALNCPPAAMQISHW